MSHVSIFRNSGGPFFKYKTVVLNGEKENEFHYLCEDGIKNLSIVITICHRSGSLMMSNSNPQDIFFYTTLRL